MKNVRVNCRVGIGEAVSETSSAIQYGGKAIS